MEIIISDQMCSHCEIRPAYYTLTLEIDTGGYVKVFVCKECMEELYEVVPPEIL